LRIALCVLLTRVARKWISLWTPATPELFEAKMDGASRALVDRVNRCLVLGVIGMACVAAAGVVLPANLGVSETPLNESTLVQFCTINEVDDLGRAIRKIAKFEIEEHPRNRYLRAIR